MTMPEAENPILYQQIFDLINDGVYFVDSQRRILSWNRAAERITGYSRESIFNRFCYDNILRHVDEAGCQLCMGKCPLAMSLEDGQIREAQVYLHHADGHRVPVTVRVLPVIEDGRITGAVEVFTERVSFSITLQNLDDLQKIAYTDPLTGIPNRRLGQIRLESAHHDWMQHNTRFGVLMADIDHFKAVNDQYGHMVGDRVLQMVARTLTHGLRPFDFVVRWGGEEFLVIASGEDLVGLKVIAERLRVLVAHSSLPLEKRQGALRVTLSVGGALALPNEPYEALLERADRNLYKSKNEGRNRSMV